MNRSCFFRLVVDQATVQRWYLSAPVDESGAEVDPRIFTDGRPVSGLRSLRIPLRRPGEEVDFNFCDFDMIVTPASLNAELQERVGSAIQRIEVRVDGSGRDFEILNVCRLVRCIDESRSQTMKWTQDDGRPDKVGQYRMIVGLKINPAAVGEHTIFRVADWPVALIVSSGVKEFFESRRVSGLTYMPVD